MRRVFLVVLLCAGCGGDGAMTFPTRGEACTDLAVAACDRFLECGAFASEEVQACQGAFVQACCGGPPNTCSLQAARSQAQVDTCVDAFDDWSCSALAQGAQPPVCTTG